MTTTTMNVTVTSPSYQAYQILHVVFSVVPIVAGLDKFVHALGNWDMYLSPLVSRILDVNGHTFMLGVGVVEVVAGLMCALAPRVGSIIVALWLCGIIVNLLTIPPYFDLALRDLGLALGAIALNRLSVEYSVL